MTRRTIIGLFGLVIAALSSLASAQQELEVQAYIQPASSITDITRVRLVIEISGGQNPQVENPQIGGLVNLRMLGNRPSTEQSTRFVNGRVSSSLRLIYALLPEATGPASIPALTIRVNGQAYTTEPIRFEVQDSPKRPSGRGAEPDGSNSSGNVVFAETRLSADEVWVGEPVMATVSVFSTIAVSDLGLSELPSFPQFLNTPIAVDMMAEARRTVIEGRDYAAYPVRRDLLIALSPGAFEIDPYTVQVIVRSRRDVFDLFARGTSVLRKTEAITLRVKPLPADPPHGFGGAVGEFQFSASLDRVEAAVNDAVALRVEVKGEGSLQAVDPPQWTVPEGLKVYDPESTLETDVSGGKLVSRKSWEWVLIPLAPGDIELNDVEFVFFNARTGRYQTEVSPALTLGVIQGESLPTAGPAVNRGVISLDRKDIAFIKSMRGGALVMPQPLLHRRAWFLSLALAPVFWVPFLIWLGRRRDLLQRDQGLARARRARRRAKKALASARKQMADGDGSTFHEEVARTLVAYVGDRFNRAPSGLTYELADDLLAERGVGTTIRARFRSCLETCDFARFVPSSGEAHRRAEVLDEAIALVDALERAC